MTTQKFFAPSANEALKQVKDKLGNDALIISSKKVRTKSGPFGMFGKEMVEIIAASDMDQDSDDLLSSNNSFNKTSIGSLPSQPQLSNQLYEVKDKISELNDRLDVDHSHGSELQHMRQEITELKGVIKSLVHQKPIFYDKDWHENLVSLYQKLTINGLDDKFAHKLIEEITKKVAKANFDDYEYLKLFVARILIQSTSVKNLFEEYDKGVVSLIGTTGIGKTTSLAKIVSMVKLNDKRKKVALITLDNFRIGAAEQLKEYSKIIRAPFKALTDPLQLASTIKQFKNYDWVFIDTPGSSQRDLTKLEALEKGLAKIPDCINLLTLNASTKDFELNETTNRFRKLNIQGTIFTKLDEASSYGSLLNHMIRYKMPLYFLTTGQDVPDDIEIASFERVIDLILNMTELDRIKEVNN